MSVLGAIQLVVLAGMSFAAGAGLLVSGPTPWILGRVRAWAPQPRHRALVLVALAPALLASALLVAVIVPSLVPLVWPGHDHCLAHDDGHLHLCAVHLPPRLGNVASWLPLLLGPAFGARMALLGLASLRRASRITAGLLARGRKDDGVGAVVLPTATPLCLLVGALRPVIVLSEGLLAAIPPSTLAVVLRHEQAHARRRDTLVRLIAQVGTALMLPSARRRLLEALELAAEQSCDEIAASSLGRMRVAEAILHVERVLSAPPTGLRPMAAFFGAHAVPQRIMALLDEPRREGHAAAQAAASLLVLATGLVLAASEPLHHLTESLLGALVH